MPPSRPKRSQSSSNVTSSPAPATPSPSTALAAEFTGASEHKPLAALEILAHLEPQEASHHLTFRIEFNEVLVERLPWERLSPRWRTEMPARATCLLGDAWVQVS